ncbi:MAG: CHAT domain-containing protein [Bryobacteraceae bacterium]
MRGNLQAAFADYEKAIEFSRRWRLDVLPADEFRISVETTLQKTYAAYIETGMELSLRNGDRQLAARMWEAMEENRSSSLRDGGKNAPNFPPVYWETMSALRSALPGEVAGDAKSTSQAAALRLKLAEIEALSGVATINSLQIKERTLSENSLIHLQQTLTGAEALISFHIGQDVSYAWAITQLGVEVRRLSSRKSIELLAKDFRQAVERGGSSELAGSKLFAVLFGSFSRAIHKTPEWLLSVDEPLFGIPFSALVEKTDSGAGQYLVERRSVRLLPGALFSASTVLPSSQHFTGIGDAIYNNADPRGSRSSERPAQQFPRLPGSGREIRVAARSWSQDREPTLLEGAKVTRNAVRSALEASPGIAHFALHVVQNPTASDQVLLALGLRGSEPEYLSPSEIAAERVSASVVVLSGCGSGTGKALPGAGLLGLTRAWLAAGARSVTATYWPIPDDAESFFQQYYSALNRTASGQLGARASAEALRVAQLHMIRNGGAHAVPRYWSAFFTVGKD